MFICYLLLLRLFTSKIIACRKNWTWLQVESILVATWIFGVLSYWYLNWTKMWCYWPTCIKYTTQSWNCPSYLPSFSVSSRSFFSNSEYFSSSSNSLTLILVRLQIIGNQNVRNNIHKMKEKQKIHKRVSAWES